MFPLSPAKKETRRFAPLALLRTPDLGDSVLSPPHWANSGKVRKILKIFISQILKDCDPMNLLFLLSLKLSLTEDTYDEMVNLSKTLPVLGLFSSYMCGFCAVLQPTWDKLAAIYENDTAVLLAHCDCYHHPTVCAKVSYIPRHPTFVIIIGNATMQIATERTLESLTTLTENLKGVDITLPCRRYFNQTEDYPYVIVSYPDETKAACEKLLQVSNRIPGFGHRFLLADSTPEMRLRIQGTKTRVSVYNESVNATSILAVALDYFHPSLVEWPMDRMKYIVVRRFAFFVGEGDKGTFRFKTFVQTHWENWCFALFNYSVFRRGYPEIEVNESLLPALGVMNREKTKFKLFQNISLNDQFREMFDNLTTNEDESEMDIVYRDPASFPPAPTPAPTEVEVESQSEIVESTEEETPSETEGPLAAVVADNGSRSLSIWVLAGVLGLVAGVVAVKRVWRWSRYLSRRAGSGKAK
jgi:hypothetical protein